VLGFARDHVCARYAYIGSDLFPDPQDIKINSVILQLTHLAAWGHIISGGKVDVVREDTGQVSLATVSAHFLTHGTLYHRFLLR
jgi:hypothetical protein